jgi:predicted aldo/keto reductase-like oxidoreductase
MKEKIDSNVSRRDFVKALGLMGVGSVVGAGSALAQPAAPADAAPAAAKPAKVPTRAFGKTGVQVSMLGLGGIFDTISNQLVLKQAMDWGVTYWDTAEGYQNGNSEKGMGMFLEKNPQARKDMFLVTKSHGGNMTDALNKSLERLKTDYVDAYFMHGDTGGFSAETKAWAEKAKADKKIHFFGFSTHSNMAKNLQDAAKAGWIDAIMLKYDYTIMQADDMKAAMDAAAKVGIGLTAMKTQARQAIKTETEADLKMGGHFIQRGFTQYQAKLKILWENPQLSCICSQMPSVTILQANIAAALDKTTLTAQDHRIMREYAEATRSLRCAGCTQFCETAPGHEAPIGDVMRCLMYHRSYGDPGLALTVFRQLPEAARRGLTGFDYAAAERACPHGLPIAQLMREANACFA